MAVLYYSFAKVLRFTLRMPEAQLSGAALESSAAGAIRNNECKCCGSHAKKVCSTFILDARNVFFDWRGDNRSTPAAASDAGIVRGQVAYDGLAAGPHDRDFCQTAEAERSATRDDRTAAHSQSKRRAAGSAAARPFYSRAALRHRPEGRDNEVETFAI